MSEAMVSRRGGGGAKFASGILTLAESSVTVSVNIDFEPDFCCIADMTGMGTGNNFIYSQIWDKTINQWINAYYYNGYRISMSPDDAKPSYSNGGLKFSGYKAADTYSWAYLFQDGVQYYWYAVKA